MGSHRAFLRQRFIPSGGQLCRRKFQYYARFVAVAALDVLSQEPLNCKDHPMRELYDMDNVILSPHLTFYSTEAMQRLEDETLERCMEILEGRPVRIKSKDPRLTVQEHGVVFEGE